MHTPAELNLVQQLLLLTLRDKKGTPHGMAFYRHALAAGTLAELILANRAKVEVDGKRKWLKLVEARPLGDGVLDECLQRLAAAKRPADPATWVQRFAGLKGLVPRVAAELCNRGILRSEERTVLFLFRRRAFPELDPKPERDILRELRRAIFTEHGPVSPRTAILVSLAYQTGLLACCFDKRSLKKRKSRIEKITSGNLLDTAVKESVQAVQAAALMAVVALPAVTAGVR